LRVIDFRAGALPAKRLYIQSVATQENVEKVITLVEKDEVSSWPRVWFVREGSQVRRPYLFSWHGKLKLTIPRDRLVKTVFSGKLQPPC